MRVGVAIEGTKANRDAGVSLAIASRRKETLPRDETITTVKLASPLDLRPVHHPLVPQHMALRHKFLPTSLCRAGVHLHLAFSVLDIHMPSEVLGIAESHAGRRTLRVLAGVALGVLGKVLMPDVAEDAVVQMLVQSLRTSERLRTQRATPFFGS